MADKKLNEVSQLTDFDYALVVKGNDVAKVTKQQLATLLGGLLPIATDHNSGIITNSNFKMIDKHASFSNKGSYLSFAKIVDYTPFFIEIEYSELFNKYFSVSIYGHYTENYGSECVAFKEHNTVTPDIFYDKVNGVVYVYYKSIQTNKARVRVGENMIMSVVESIDTSTFEKISFS